MSATSRFLAKPVFWAVGLVGVAAVGGWLYFQWYVPQPKHAEVRLVAAENEIPLSAFGEKRKSNPRSIATVTACFTRRTWLKSEVLAIEDGQILGVEQKTTGRSSQWSRPDDPYLMTLSVTFGLADVEFDHGHSTLLHQQGGSRSFGNFGGIHKRFEITSKAVFEGPMNPGDHRLLCVEGDREFVARADMTPQEFAAVNPSGNFLLVMLRFER